MLVLAILLLAGGIPSVLSEKCQITTPDGELKTGETLQLVAGEMLELNCTAPELPVGESLTFTWGKADLQKYTETFPEERRAVLRVENTVPFAGVSHVYCGYRDLQDCGKHVLIGYPPVKPQNIRCESQALKQMVCRWDPVKSEEDLKIHTSWTLTYRIGIHSDMVNCPDQRKTQDACFWASTNLDDVRMAFKRGHEYHMTVTANNALGRAQSDEIIVDPDKIESSSSDADCPYPSPMSCLWKSISSEKHNQAFKRYETYYVTVTATNKLGTVSVSGSCTPKLLVKPNRVQVHTDPQMKNGSLPVIVEIPYNLEEIIKQFEYFLSVTCLAGRNESDVIKQGIGSGRVSFLLDTLVPNCNYLLSAMIKPNASGYWSDPNNVTIVTNEAAPETSPLAVAFTQCQGGSRGKRRVDVYWQYLDSVYSNGNITNYRVKVTSSAGTWTNNTTDLFSPMTLDYLNTTDDYYLQMAAATSAGWGPYSQPVQLPPLAQELPLAVDVTAERRTGEDGQISVNISWTMPSISQVPYAKVYVCTGHIERPMDVYLAKCEGKVHTEDVVMSANAKRQWHHVSSRADVDLVVGVALMNAGITWAECLADRNTEPSQMRGVVVPYVETNAVVVRWNMISCGVQIRGYQMSYRPMKGASRPDCDDGIKQDFRGGRKTVEVRLNNLAEATKYTICARALTANGKYSPWSEIVLVETIKPPPWKIITSTVVPLFLLIVFAIAIIVVYRFIQKPIPVETVPEIKIDATNQNYTSDDYTTMDGYEAPQTPRENQADNKRDSGNGSMSGGSEPSTESNQPPTGKRSYSAESAAVKLPRTEAVQATVRQTHSDSCEETEAKHPLLSNGYVPQPQARVLDESRETTRLLSPSTEDKSFQHSGPCADMYVSGPNDLLYIHMRHNGNLSYAEGLPNRVDRSFTANELCGPRNDSSCNVVHNACKNGDGRLRQRAVPTSDLASSSGDHCSGYVDGPAEVETYGNRHTPSSSGGRMDSYSRFGELSRDTDVQRSERIAATNSTSTVDSYSKLGSGAALVIENNSRATNLTVSPNSTVSSHSRNEEQVSIPSIPLTSDSSTTANDAGNGIAPYSRLAGDPETPTDFCTSSMRDGATGIDTNHRDDSVRDASDMSHSGTQQVSPTNSHGQTSQLNTGTNYTSDATSIFPSFDRGIDAYTRFDQHQVKTLCTTKTMPDNANDSTSFHKHSNTCCPISEDEEELFDNRCCYSGNPPLSSDYQCQFPDEPSNYLPHPPDPLDIRNSGKQAQPSDYQSRPWDNKGQSSYNQRQSLHSRHPSECRLDPSEYQRDQSEYRHDPSGYRSDPSEYQHDPFEYRRHEPEHLRHESDYPHCSSQYHPSESQYHPQECQRRQSEYQRDPSEYQYSPSEYQRPACDSRRHPSGNQIQPYDHQGQHSDYQRHPSDCRRYPSNYKRQPCDRQRLLRVEEPQLCDCQHQPPDHKYQPSSSFSKCQSPDYQSQASENQRQTGENQGQLSENQPDAPGCSSQNSGYLFSSSYSRFSVNFGEITESQPRQEVFEDLNIAKHEENSKKTFPKPKKDENPLCSPSDASDKNFYDDAFAVQDVNCNNETNYRGNEIFVDDLHFDSFAQENIIRGISGTFTDGNDESIAEGGDGSSTLAVSSLLDNGTNRQSVDNPNIVWVQRSKSSTAKDDYCVKETVL